MEKSFFAVLLFLCCTIAFAQEKKASIGIAPEFNMDSRHNFAGGVSLSFDHTLPINAAIGLAVTGSSNFSGFNTLESAVFVRGYLPNKKYSGFFLQGYLGAFVFFEDEEVTPMLFAGVGGGYRFLLGSLFYIEPYGRLGYPFAFGVGVMTGIRF